MAPLRVAVVGTCASGKTSVVAALRDRGLDAYAVAQEHSAIAALWRHLEPDRLVYLDNRLETIQRRRHDDSWPEWIYQLQLKRLHDARAQADVVVTTDDLEIDEIVQRILAALGGGGGQDG